MNTNRRSLLRNLALAPAAVAVVSAAPSAAAAQGTAAALPPMARIKLGRFEVTFITDGSAEIPYGFFSGIAPEDAASAARGLAGASAEAVRLNFTQYLIRDGAHTVLVDAGPAGGIGDTGRMPAALAALGVAERDVDAVIVTHGHFDHLSGLIAGGRAHFSDAEVYIDNRDVAYFSDPARETAAPDFLKGSFKATQDLLRLHPRVQRIDGEREIVPGLSIVDLTGHTPGHIGVRIADAGQSLLLVSDMLFHPSVHPGSAEVGFVFEQDPEAAAAMRRAFFPLAAEEGALIAATHMPFPGLGRIVTDRGALRWAPADWSQLG